MSPKNSKIAAVALPPRRRPRVLPPTVRADPPPQPPDLRGPRSAFREQAMARLPLPAVTPPALVRLQSLGPGHSVMEERADRRMARKQLVVQNARSGASEPCVEPYGGDLYHPEGGAFALDVHGKKLTGPFSESGSQ